MPRHFLIRDFGIEPDRDFDGPPIFSGAHDATVKMVESGKVAAGALSKLVWDRLVREGGVEGRRVRVIWTTPAYSDYCWTARKALDPELRKNFAAAFVALDRGNPEDKVILDLQGAKKFVRAQASDFDAIEAVARSTGLLK